MQSVIWSDDDDNDTIRKQKQAPRQQQRYDWSEKGWEIS